MNCAECGALLPDDAAACGTCGRRVVPERIEPVLDPGVARLDATSAPRATTGALSARKPKPAPPLPAPLPRAPHPLLAYLPKIMVGVGVVLAIAIYWSSSRDDDFARRAGADRLARTTGPLKTSQPASPVQQQFSARQALQGLYGNYDPVLDGAYWTISGAPKNLAEWNGKAVVIKPLISRSDASATRHVLVTHSVEVKNGMAVKQGTSCRNCKSLVGGAQYERRGLEWKLVADHRFLASEGAYGAPPTVAIEFPDTQTVELRVDRPAADPIAVREPGSVIVLKGGKALRTVIARPAAVEKRDIERPLAGRREVAPIDSPFPSAAAEP